MWEADDPGCMRQPAFFSPIKEGTIFILIHFSITEYLSPGRALSVRMYVCVSVRVSNSYNFRPIFMKLGPHNLSKNLR